jgi:hypothetical protein
MLNHFKVKNILLLLRMSHLPLKLFSSSLVQLWCLQCVTVLNVHEVHTSAGCPKQCLRVLVAMPTEREIDSADLWCCRFVKEKSAAQIVDEHGLDDGMSTPCRKTRQGHRLTRTGVVEEFGSAGIGSLHADANSAARSSLCKSGARLGTI